MDSQLTIWVILSRFRLCYHQGPIRNVDTTSSRKPRWLGRNVVVFNDSFWRRIAQAVDEAVVGPNGFGAVGATFALESSAIIMVDAPRIARCWQARQ
jgi:hypothetical protein